MNVLKAYAGVSVLLGLLLVADGVLLLTAKLSVANWYIAVAELLWIPVSLAFFVVALAVRRHWWIPASYLLYVLWGSIYTVYSLGKVSPENLVTPFAALVGVLFGVYFALANVWSCRQ